MNTTAAKPILASRIAPVIAAFSLFAAGSAQADSAGVTAINNKLATIPGIKLGTTVATATSANLIYALSLALDALPNTATASDYAKLVESALSVDADLKYRKDKDKIAGQIIATAIANNNITDGAIIGAITEAVFNVNAGNVKAALTPRGKAVALAGALKAANPTAAALIGTELGGSTAGDFSGDVALLLSDTAKALGTSSANAASSIEAFVKAFLNDELTTDADRKTQAEAAAIVSAKKTPAAAGSILGGYIGTKGVLTNGTLQTIAQSYVSTSKLAKAIGDVLAYTMDAHSNKAALFSALSGGDRALIAQGLLRAGSAGEASATINAFLAANPDRVKTAGVVAAGNGDNESKLATIVTALATGQDDIKAKPAIGAAVISSIAALNPESADAAIRALIDAGAFADDTARNALGALIAPKVKSYAAVGFMAAGIAEENISRGANPASAALATATAVSAKASKAATDIAYRAASISGVNVTQFAVSLANANPKIALNAAVGAALADQSLAGDITKAVIGRSPTDKASIAKAPLIAGAVAAAVDEERASEIAFRVGELVSETGTDVGKPVKASSFKTLATSLAKVIQAKANVTTANRRDELGELASLLTNAIITAYGGSGLTDVKKIAARDKAIIAAGSEFLKVLSKKPLEESKTLIADQSAAKDIAGSVALTIRNGLATGANSALLASGGALEKALTKLAGKIDGPSVAVAIQEVHNGVQGALDGYEDGNLRETSGLLSVKFNDKETDKRNR